VCEQGVAWVTAAPGLVAAVRSAKQFLTYVASGPFQYAVAEALALPDSYFTAFRDDMLAKRDLLAAGLTEAGFEAFRSAGTYFITTDIRPSAKRTASPSAAPCRSGRASWPSPTRCSTTTGRRATVRAVRVLQEGRRSPRGHQPPATPRGIGLRKNHPFFAVSRGPPDPPSLTTYGGAARPTAGQLPQQDLREPSS
jgi:hypothetical protein